MPNNTISHYFKIAPWEVVEKCQEIVQVTVIKIKIKGMGFGIRLFINGGRISNINNKLKIKVFSLSCTKVYE